MSDIWRKIIATSSVRAYSLLVGLATLVVTARVLGPEGRGILAGVGAWVHLFQTLGSFSIGQVIVHRAVTERQRAWLGSFFGGLLSLAILLSFLLWVLAAGIGSLNHEVYGKLPVWALFLGFLSLPFYIWESYGANLLISSGNLTFYNRAQLFTTSIGFILLVVVLILFDGGVRGAFIAILMTGTLTSMVLIMKLWGLAAKRFTISIRDIGDLLTDGLKLHLNAIGGVLLTVANTLMINYYSGPEEVGWYHLASQMIAIMIVLPQAATKVLNEMTAQSGPDRVWPDQKRILGKLMCLMLLMGVLGYYLCPWAVVLVAGERFLPSVDPFRVLLLSVVGVSLSYGMTNQWLGRGLFLQTGLLTFIFGGANIFLNAVLIPQYGMIAAAWSTVLVYTMGICTNLAMVLYVESKWRTQYVFSQRGS